MKRLTLMTALLATLAAPALFAQSSLNTTAPGPSQETKPGQTNNNLQNPGSNMQQPAAQSGTYQEHGTVEGTASESTTGTNSMNNQTGTSTGTTGTTGTNGNTGTMGTTGTMNNNTTGTTTGTMNNDSTTGSTTTGTGSYNGSSSTGAGTGMSSTDTTNTSTTSSGSLPRTASELPTVAIAGLLALAAFFAVRLYSKRNA